MAVKKFVTCESRQGKGFITHDDQEIDGLSFKCFPDSDTQLVIISGESAKVTAWITRNSAVGATKAQASTFLQARLAAYKTKRVAELDAEKIVVQTRVIEEI